MAEKNSMKVKENVKVIHVECIYDYTLNPRDIVLDTFLFNSINIRYIIYSNKVQYIYVSNESMHEIISRWLLWCGSFNGFKYLTISIPSELVQYIVHWSKIMCKELDPHKLIGCSYYGYKILSNKPINIWWFTPSNIIKSINSLCSDTTGLQCLIDKQLLNLTKIICRRVDNVYTYKLLYTCRKCIESVENVAWVLKLLLCGKALYTMRNPDVYIKILWTK